MRGVEMKSQILLFQHFVTQANTNKCVSYEGMCVYVCGQIFMHFQNLLNKHANCCYRRYRHIYVYVYVCLYILICIITLNFHRIPSHRTNLKLHSAKVTLKY